MLENRFKNVDHCNFCYVIKVNVVCPSILFIGWLRNDQFRISWCARETPIVEVNVGKFDQTSFIQRIYWSPVHYKPSISHAEELDLELGTTCSVYCTVLSQVEELWEKVSKHFRYLFFLWMLFVINFFNDRIIFTRKKFWFYFMKKDFILYKQGMNEESL